MIEIEWGLGGAYCLIAIFGLVLVYAAAKALWRIR